MHIAEGVLAWPILAGGTGIALGGVAIGLHRLDANRIPQTAILAAAFFVASLIHVPIGPGNMHLILNGLMGIVLGWACVPAILVALLLQGILFQFGGLTALGVNTVIMALPALACGVLFKALRPAGKRATAGLAFALGAGAVLGSGLVAAAALTLSGQAFVSAAKLLFVAHLPVSGVEGALTAGIVGFLGTVKPAILYDSGA